MSLRNSAAFLKLRSLSLLIGKWCWFVHDLSTLPRQFSEYRSARVVYRSLTVTFRRYTMVMYILSIGNVYILYFYSKYNCLRFVSRIYLLSVLLSLLEVHLFTFCRPSLRFVHSYHSLLRLLQVQLRTLAWTVRAQASKRAITSLVSVYLHFHQTACICNM
jgi:hypothetical protein